MSASYNKASPWANTPIVDNSYLGNFQIRPVPAESDDFLYTIETQEASHRSIFVSGWRPFLGWVSGLSIGYVYLFQPILDMILQMFQVQVDWVQLDLGQLMPLVLGMLGLGGLRSFEKAKGLTK